MLENYYRINKAAGISIHINTNGTVDINFCNIVLENNDLNFEKKLTGLLNINDLTKHIPLKSIVALNLSGKGILTKQIEKTEEITSAYFSKVLPNANPDDFYIQNFISGKFSFVSVVRKTDADKLINTLISMGFIPLSLSLGPFPAQNIISQLNVYGSEITFDANIIYFDEQNNWTATRYEVGASSTFPLKIELEPLDERLVLPYAVAFQLLLAAKIELIKANVPLLKTTLEEKLSNNKIKVKGFIILAIFFVLLLINFIVFSWLDASNKKLASQVNESNRSSSDLQTLNDQITQKEGLLNGLGWEEGINKSALIDQIAALLPPELTWQELAINPVDLNSSRTIKSLVFYNREIKVIGYSEKIIPVNEWIARVKTKSWVKNIQLDNYTYNSELNTGQFSITINY